MISCFWSCFVTRALAAFHKVSYFRFYSLFWEHLVPRMNTEPDLCAHAHTRTHAHTHTHTHRESAAVFCPHITWLSVPENPSRHVLTSQHGDSFTQTLSGPGAKQSGNPSARLCEGVIKRGVKTDPNPPGAQRVSLLYHQTRTHAPLKPNQRNAWGCLQSVLLIPKKK